jgi:hypothetical protein
MSLKIFKEVSGENTKVISTHWKNGYSYMHAME